MLKIAFATSDRVIVDQHFGAAAGFAIYWIDGDNARLVEVTEYPLDSMDGNEDKLASRIAALAGCAAVYCLAVGGSAVRQLLAGGVQPVRVEEGTDIDSLLLALRKAIREGGVAWIDKLIRREVDARRFDRMAEEGWQE
jgi:nitrogen fixation protein NifX